MIRKCSTAVLCCLAIAATHVPLHASTAAQNESGRIVITFADGHQQSFAASSVARMEFKSAAGVASPISLPSSFVPGRRHFVGKWVVGDGAGGSFTIVLEESGEAKKTHGAGHGTWTYKDGEARIVWDDGWHDVIRKAGSSHEKVAYAPGKSFDDAPDNVAAARMGSATTI